MTKASKHRLILLGAIVLFGALAVQFFSVFSRRQSEVLREEEISVRISEIMSANNRFPNASGELADWIELHNFGTEAADLSGWGLSDRRDAVSYLFPTGSTIPANGYIVVYCSGQSGTSAEARFGIRSDGGESICLWKPNTAVPCEEVLTPSLFRGESYALNDDGRWSVHSAPTPGFSNDEAGLEEMNASVGSADSAVIISEVMAANDSTVRDRDGSFSDWIELYNSGTETADLSGWFLSDSREEPLRWKIPSLRLAPGEYRLIFCSGKNRSGSELHTDFSLARDSGELILFTPTGIEAASFVYSGLEADQSACFAVPEPSVGFMPTPGYPNTPEGYEEFLSADDRPGALIISEVVSSNDGTLKDGLGGTYDWIELRNTSSSTISLGEYCLSDDKDAPQKARLPDVKLAPGAFCIVFCTGKEVRQDSRSIYVPFSVSTAGEHLYLFDSGGRLSDRVFVHDVAYRGSFGRLEGRSGFFYMEPTPKKANKTGTRFRSGDVSTDTPAGIYNNVDELSVALIGNGTIYYTLDGSIPTEKSAVYTEPLRLTETTSIRAAVLAPDRALGDVSTYSYIINENHTVPVLSLVCDPGEFKYLIRHPTVRSLECDAVLSLFNEAGTEFSLGCGVRMHGNASRVMAKKKMFVAEFYNRFDGMLFADLFQNGIDHYSSLCLRGENAETFFLLRDSVAALVANRVCDTVLALDNRYCVLYINSEYYGIYPLREDYSAQYVADHTGCSVDSARVVKAPVRSGDAENADLYAILTGIIDRDMADAENYAWASEHLDMTAMADWLLLEGYFNNSDVGGNVRYVLGDNFDGKWRPAFYDFDLALTNRNAGFQSVVYTGDQVGNVCLSLTDSPEFCALCCERCVMLLQNGLAKGAAVDAIDECNEAILSEIPREPEWLGEANKLWDVNVQVMRTYFNEDRTTRFIHAVSSLLHLTGVEKAEYFGGFLEGAIE